MSAKHAKDSDCNVGADGCCQICGVSHTDVCPKCGGRGFHVAPCWHSLPEITDPDAALVELRKLARRCYEDISKDPARMVELFIQLDEYLSNNEGRSPRAVPRRPKAGRSLPKDWR
jgi:hypothetical protein